MIPVGLYFRLVCTSGWFVLPVGLYFRLVCTSGWFVLPVGVYEWKITTALLTPPIRFKNVFLKNNSLKTFEAEPPIFKNIQPLPRK